MTSVIPRVALRARRSSGVCGGRNPLLGAHQFVSAASFGCDTYRRQTRHPSCAGPWNLANGHAGRRAGLLRRICQFGVVPSPRSSMKSRRVTVPLALALAPTTGYSARVLLHVTTSPWLLRASCGGRHRQVSDPRSRGMWTSRYCIVGRIVKYRRVRPLSAVCPSQPEDCRDRWSLLPDDNRAPGQALATHLESVGVDACRDLSAAVVSSVPGCRVATGRGVFDDEGVDPPAGGIKDL